MKILLVAGGTGGHLFPAIALAQASEGMDVTLLTDQRGARFCHNTAGLFDKIVVLKGLKKQRGLFSTPITLLMQGALSFWYLVRHRPHMVWGFGGMTTVCALFLAKILRIPCGIHQSDRVLGKANRFLVRFVSYVALGHEETRFMPTGKKPDFIGTPVREGFDAIPALETITLPLCLLVLGGSQGSAFWNTLMPCACALLSLEERQQITIVHQCPKGTTVTYPEGIVYETPSFIDDMQGALAKAHLVLSRAGASCVAELCAAGRPALFVPYPFSADDHQKENARYVVAQGGGWMEDQKDLSCEKLAHFLRNCLYDHEKLLQKGKNIRALSKKDAAKTMAHFIKNTIGEGR